MSDRSRASAAPARAVAPRLVAERPVGRVPLMPVLALLALVATWFAAGLPGFGLSFFYCVLVAGLVRVMVGLDGDTLVPRKLFVVLATVLGVASVIWLFGLRSGGRGAAIVGMLCVVAAFQSLLLLGSLQGVRAYVVVLLSSVHAVGTAFLRKDLEALFMVMAYVVVLLWTMLLYERRHALDRPPPRTATVRRVRRIHKQPLPWAVGLRTLAMLVLIGFPLAIVFIAVVPPVSSIREAYDFTETPDEVAGLSDSGTNSSEARWITGPPRNTSHVEYGSEAPIKESHVTFCEVKEPGSVAPPFGIYLRDNVQDLYSASGDWDASKALLDHNSEVLKPSPEGWMSIPGDAVPGGAIRSFAITLYRGAYGRFYLQPRTLRARVWRKAQILTKCEISYRGNETLRLRFPDAPNAGFLPGDVIEQVAIIPPNDRRVLRNRRSDAGVAPLDTYLSLPESTRRVVQPLAERLVRGMDDPWDRAQVLEAYLKAQPFEYSLAVVGFEGDDNMADFFTRTKRGHCGRYATALAALLRSLGHPARYARGFWGGEVQETRGSVVFRMKHYHAWTELFLDGVGWVPLNPTPPDRTAIDEQVTDHNPVGAELEDDAEAEEPPAETPTVLQFDREAYDEFWNNVGAFLRDVLVTPARWLFGPRSGFSGAWLLFLLLFVSLWRGRRRTLVRRAAGPDGRLPQGVYGRALLLLAKRGFYRKPHQTPRELLEAVALMRPAARDPLLVITQGFEQERYAGRGKALSRPGIRTAMSDLDAALTAKS